VAFLIASCFLLRFTLRHSISSQHSWQTRNGE